MQIHSQKFLFLISIAAGSVAFSSCGQFIVNSTKGSSYCSGDVPGSCFKLSTASVTYPQVVPMGGCTITDYTVSTQIGPTSGFNLIVDSGSTDMGAASTNCSNCGSLSPGFVEAYGKSEGLSLTDTYGSGSWTGNVYTNYVTIESLPSVKMSFGAITSHSSFFSSGDCYLGYTGSNKDQGILGMAYESLAGISGGGYLDNLLTTDTSYPNIFAIQSCQNGGNLWFGGYDSSYTTTTPQYTPVVSSGYYTVTLNDIAVGGVSLGLSASTYETPLVDNGTSLTQLPTTVYDALVTEITSDSNFVTAFGSSYFSNGSCLTSTSTQTELDANLPSLTLTFPLASGSTFTVTLPPTKSYLDMHTTSSGRQYYCPGIASSSSYSIIGGSFMRDLIVIFDKANNQVGFALQTGCAS